MWLLFDLGYLLLAFVFWLLLCIPTSLLWESRWNARQLRLKAKPDTYFKYREERLLDTVGYAIIAVAIAGAFVLTMLCRDWWGG